MYLSSKLAACVCLGTLSVLPVASAEAAGLAHAPAVATPMVGPRVMHVGPGPGRFPGYRFRRFGNGYGIGGYGIGGYGYGGYGLGGYGFGESVSTTSFDGAPSYPTYPPPAYAIPPIPPQPACPMIIKVGPGLDHPAQTRVIYGRPEC